MDIPLNITFHNTRKTANIEEFIADQAENLQKFHKRIQNCEVVIDQPHHHHQKGNEYYVKIVVTVPKQTIAVTSSTSRSGDHENLYGAIHDAFDSVKRKLRQQRRKLREKTVRKAAKELALGEFMAFAPN